jgi:two-component system, OmpR family, manganese sensing sensor histidine kinase
MFQSTRRRLALWYTIVTAIVLLFIASSIYLYVRSTLIERIDDTLNHVVEIVERSLVLEPTKSGLTWSIDGSPDLNVNVEASFRNNGNTSDDDHIDIEWFSREGQLLWTTFTEPVDIALHPDQKGETVTIQRDRYGEALVLRQITDRIQKGRQVLGYLRVSHPWFEVTVPTHQLLIDLGIALPLMIATVAGIGWLLSGVAIRPADEAYLRLKQFTADASHELRNPIAMIQTNVQAALADQGENLRGSVGGPATEQRQQLLVVERLTRRLGRLVDDLLFLARQDSAIVPPQRSAIALDEVLMEVVEEQTVRALEQKIDLNIEWPDDLDGEGAKGEAFQVLGDRDHLARLFTNLVSNALQYTPEGGQVTVQLARDLETMRGRSVAVLQVRVADTGIGMAAEVLPFLFERFYRVDLARRRQANAQLESGSGLGLAIAGSIVTSHHGQISVTSEVGKGAVFTVVLPRWIG